MKKDDYETKIEFKKQKSLVLQLRWRRSRQQRLRGNK